MIGLKNLSASKIRCLRFIYIFLLAGILSGCGSDPFGMNQKKLRGKYYIEKYDAALPPTYYVIEKGIESGGGVFDGILISVGWKGDQFIADVKRLSSLDPNGWYILDLNNGNISGPISNQSIIESFKTTDVQSFFKDPKSHKK